MELRTSRQQLLPLIGIVVALLSLSIWGGVVEMSPQLLLGFAISGGLIIAFGIIAWWLLLSPLPALKVSPARLTPATRQLLALLVTGSAALLMIGLTWDEAWHRIYGVPIGEDFFWRPHILMYISFGLVTLFAFGGLAVINRNPGTLRHKFRAEPLLGLLVLMSGFMLLSLPVDPLWHQIYGVDLTAWSLPHLVMFGAAGLIFILGAAIQASVIPKTGWKVGFGLREGIAAYMLSQSVLILLILLVVEWDGTHTEMMQMPDIFYARPQWLFPALIVGVTAFFGLLTQRLFQRVGLATFMGILTILTRWIMIEIVGGTDVGMTIRPQLIGLIPLVLLDLVMFVRMKQADTPLTLRLAIGAAVTVGMAITLIIIGQWYVVPQITPGFLLQTVIFGIPLSLLLAAYGAQVGGALQRMGGNEGVQVAAARAVLLRGAVGVVVMIALMAVFLVTATPPVT
ncbi:MAG: hypothetical protein SF123_21055 [Chloroflexota bacterium]|nr:hypothetical protein [Chloroflexota bacterium]